MKHTTDDRKLARWQDSPFYRRGNHFRRRNNFVPMNIIQNDDVYKVEMELPGWSKDEVKVEIDNDTLKIYGKKEEVKEDSRTVHLKEFYTNRFYRSVILNDEVNQDEISAEMENGILKIELKKYSKEERPGYRKVEIL